MRGGPGRPSTFARLVIHLSHHSVLDVIRQIGGPVWFLAVLCASMVVPQFPGCLAVCVPPCSSEYAALVIPSIHLILHNTSRAAVGRQAQVQLELVPCRPGPRFLRLAATRHATSHYKTSISLAGQYSVWRCSLLIISPFHPASKAMITRGPPPENPYASTPYT